MTDEEKNIFGKQLRERRNELNLTTQKVALDAEVGESTYKRLEAGDGNPRLDTLVRIVKCLKTDLNSVVPQEHLCKDSGIWQIVRKLLSMDKKKMDIQPEIQELLVAIFDTDFFGAKGKPKAGIDVKQRLRAQLAENVEIYLDEDVKKQVKSAPQFLNARLEDILTEKINNEVRGMFATMQDSDDTIQYQLMLETLDRLVAIRRWMNEWNARINLIKQEFAKTEQEKQDAKNKTGLFKHKQLQDILIDVISNLLEGKEYEYISEEEEIFYPTLYAASKMYDITAMPGNELTLWLQEVEKNISNLKRYQYILKKAKDLFDENDYLEKKILDSIDKITRTQLVSNESEMTPEQYERLVRFTEDASMEEKQEILCKLEQSGNLTLDEQTLKEIMEIKDAIEKKREYGML